MLLFYHVSSSSLNCDLYVLIKSVIINFFISNAEPSIPTWVPTKEAKAETETHPVTVDHRYVFHII